MIVDGDESHGDAGEEGEREKDNVFDFKDFDKEDKVDVVGVVVAEGPPNETAKQGAKENNGDQLLGVSKERVFDAEVGCEINNVDKADGESHCDAGSNNGIND